MTEWRSYDGIAPRYDAVWAARFEPTARRLADLVGCGPDDSVLDVGTGTGIVPLAFGRTARAPRRIVGCDRSHAMLLRATAQVPGLCAVRADFNALPFGAESFSVVTASFVLSHTRDYRSALAQARRVLKPAGALALSNWGPSTDPHTQAWSECLAEAISKPEVERAQAEVAPWEDYFSEPGRLESVVRDAGFSLAASDSVDSKLELTMDQFLDDRALSSGGRLGRHLLGAERWDRLLAAARARFLARFGPRIRYSRRALIVLGRKTA